MKYGFIIDNRKCIGCHACTVACKAEHDVPIGVNRTWVKQVEKGTFPNTTRVFSVMRCNHCTEAPCVEICPVEALHIREDGIVDFDKDRCIGCKSCMQACPYDALYIEPDNHTAAKCNYCAHRVDVGLEPACVNVCPEHAIISGDMDDPNSEISQLLGRERVTVRKPEKGTEPNLFYINGDEASLTPGANERSDQYFWNSQSGGVGHYAKYAEQKAGQADKEKMMATLAETQPNGHGQQPKKQIEAIMEASRRVYDTPDKGSLWGWEVSAYVWTKAISAGAFLIPFFGSLMGLEISALTWWVSGIVALVFLSLTGGLLIKDLDRPDRFHYVLFRPQWRSWLVRGGYSFSLYGLFVTLFLASRFFDLTLLAEVTAWLSAVFALLTAVYTAFLFAQAKGRDFWQSPALALHMLVHSLMAGVAVFMIGELFVDIWPDEHLGIVMTWLILANLGIILFELVTPHPTTDAKRTVKMIVSGPYKMRFWVMTILAGNLIPLALIHLPGALTFALAAALVYLGIFVGETIWVQAPQRIALS